MRERSMKITEVGLYYNQVFLGNVRRIVTEEQTPSQAVKYCLRDFFKIFQINRGHLDVIMKKCFSIEIFEKKKFAPWATICRYILHEMRNAPIRAVCVCRCGNSFGPARYSEEKEKSSKKIGQRRGRPRKKDREIETTSFGSFLKSLELDRYEKALFSFPLLHTNPEAFAELVGLEYQQLKKFSYSDVQEFTLLEAMSILQEKRQSLDLPKEQKTESIVEPATVLEKQDLELGVPADELKAGRKIQITVTLI